jgi:hypothetical protein
MILKDWDRIHFLQVLTVYLYPFTTCAFHMSLHSFLMGMEDIFYYLNKDNDYLKAVFIGLKFLRRSPFGPLRFVGRVGSSGFTGGMGEPPHGNWRRIVAWTTVALGAIAAKAAVDAYNSHNRAKVDMHDSDNRAQANATQHAQNPGSYTKRWNEMSTRERVEAMDRYNKAKNNQS